MQNLKRLYQEESHYNQRGQDSFRTLRLLLEEMLNTLKSQYIESEIYDDHAALEVGNGEDKVQWIIKPSLEKPGYCIEKNQYFDGEQDSDLFTFDSETETIEYVVKEIVEKVVYCRYWKRD